MARPAFSPGDLSCDERLCYSHALLPDRRCVACLHAASGLRSQRLKRDLPLMVDFVVSQGLFEEGPAASAIFRVPGAGPMDQWRILMASSKTTSART
ncbi:MAG: hypothetical protein KIT32_18880, partial [Rhodocyclaceae bacterium]|nr:hypothetical protein [Rhodocyclaceae bacterium]